MNILLGLGVGLVFFISTIKAYTLGLKHGKQLVNNEVPRVEPIKEIFEKAEENKKVKEFESAMEEYWR